MMGSGLLYSFLLSILVWQLSSQRNYVPDPFSETSAVSAVAWENWGNFDSGTTPSRPSLQPDTLELTTVAGDVLITILPDSAASLPVIEYGNIRVPARSWRSGRAFFWQTAGNDAGVHSVEFLRRTAAAIDTMTLYIHVTR